MCDDFWLEEKQQGQFSAFGDIMRGDPGPHYTPAVDENGNLSWTNNGNLPNPETVNIKGEKGDPGDLEFIAIYDETTYDEIAEAEREGRLIVAKDSGFVSDEYYQLSDGEFGADTWGSYNAYVFTRFDVDSQNNKTLFVVRCKKHDGSTATTWERESLPVDLADDLLEPVEQTIKPTPLGPAAIATFDASAADMPLKGLTVDIEPVQNLHGYDHPWPAGGGKNLLEVTATTGTVNGVTFTVKKDTAGNVLSIIANGTASENVSGTIYLFGTITLPPGKYSINGLASGSQSTYRLTVYDSAAGTVNVSVYGGADRLFELTETTTLIVYPIILKGQTVSNVEYKPMIRLTTETDNTFEPYSNICPITGWTGCNVTRTGKLPYDERLYPMTRDKIINASTGEPANSGANNCASGFVPISDFQGKTLRLNHRPTGASGGIAFYDANRNYIPDSGLANNNAPVGTSWDFDVPATAIYMRFTSHNDYIGHISVVVIAETQEIPITFPSPDPGTVYGGTLDVVNKKLTVTHKGVDMGSATYQYFESGTYFRSTTFTDIAPGSVADSVCSIYVKSNMTSVSDMSNGEYTIDGTRSRFYVHDERYTDPAELQTALTGQLLVYRLATPIVYDLSDIPEITTLLGENNIWADCGDVTVTYGAYLETVKAHAERLGDSILSAIAPVETSYVATRDYAIGSYLFVGTKFYKVTAAIGSGDTINPGTNVTQTTVAAQLMELAGN